MNFFTTLFNQKITVWPNTGHDRYGQPKFGSPTTVDGRREKTGVLYKDREGRDQVSDSIFYMDADAITVVAGDFIYLGSASSTDPINFSGAQEVMTVQTSPSVDAQNTLCKVIV